MKTLLLVLLVIIFSSCNKGYVSKNLQKMNCIHDSVFTIYSDTNYIAIEGWPSAAIQFNGGVYTLFDHQGSVILQ